tara:strand:+ start:4037 stop:6001 length:1965 start_codon:yes stop_codon:yes gene_type:complete
MFYRKLGQRTIGVITCVTMLFIMGYSVFAAEPHEDPETAMPVYGYIALLDYYSNMLDSTIGEILTEVGAGQENMPFANIPQSMKGSIDEFVDLGVSLFGLMAVADEDMNEVSVLMRQHRLNEVVELTSETFDALSQANSVVSDIEQIIETIGEESEVFLAPTDSGLRLAYDGVLEMVGGMKEMLASYNDLLINVAQEREEIEKEFLEPGITLEVQPITAFVGDNIRFEGELTFENGPLADRKVDIMLNSSRHIAVYTDNHGNYQGTLWVPYWYESDLNLQALYYPQGEDLDVYLASLSPVSKLEVLFYQTELEVAVDDQAYPGMGTIITGKLEYDQSPPPDDRKVEIYLGDIYIAEIRAEEAFTQKIAIPPETDAGKHIITASSIAMGKYSPVVASAVLDVTKVTPFLDIDIPRVAFIPGSVGLKGKLHSEIGLPNGASIMVGLDESKTEFASSDDGSFDAEIKMGMGFSLISSEDLSIQVFPQEPWYAPSETTEAVLVVNFMNCGLLLVVIVSLGIFLPGRLRRLASYPKDRLRPITATVPPESAPVYSITRANTALAGKTKEEPRNRIFFWYRLVARLIQGITKIILRPQQTLREFANESSGALGSAARLFMELTRRVEKLLYSKYVPSEEDAKQSQQLSHTIEVELKNEGV